MFRRGRGATGSASNGIRKTANASRPLTVAKGVVLVMGEPRKSVTYGALVGGKPFHLPFTGKAPLKSFRDYKIVGTRVPRKDIPEKAAGKYVHMQHVRVPGMLHGRVVRPRGQGAFGNGAKVLSVGEWKAHCRIVSGARVIRKRDFVGVVAPNEWDAVRAAAHVDQPPVLPGTDGMHQQMRASKTIDRVVLRR